MCAYPCVYTCDHRCHACAHDASFINKKGIDQLQQRVCPACRPQHQSPLQQTPQHSLCASASLLAFWREMQALLTWCKA